MTKNLIVICALLLLPSLARSAELSGVFVEDVIDAKNGDTLVLNGMGLREKFWVDVYVGSLYLIEKTSKVSEILSSHKAWRIQIDVVYKEVDKEKLVSAWKDGFEKNQPDEVLEEINERMEQFYGYFDRNAVANDQYILDYIPGKGTTIALNEEVLGTISGDDFKNPLLEIWLGNHPADKKLKKGMLGLK